MKRTFVVWTAVAFAALAGAAAKSLALKDLPAPVQKTVNDNLKGGEIKNISKEVEKGITEYEIETMLNGKHRDFDVTAAGKLVDVEQEVDIATIPAAAKTTIEKKFPGGKLVMVESVDKGDGILTYEASYTTKAGKKGEVSVKADGTEIKED
jgi:hypothetical protein